MDGVLIYKVEVAEDGTVRIDAMIPASFTFKGITEQLRPFALEEGPSPQPARA